MWGRAIHPAPICVVCVCAAAIAFGLELGLPTQASAQPAGFTFECLASTFYTVNVTLTEEVWGNGTGCGEAAYTQDNTEFAYLFSFQTSDPLATAGVNFPLALDATTISEFQTGLPTLVGAGNGIAGVSSGTFGIAGLRTVTAFAGVVSSEAPAMVSTLLSDQCFLSSSTPTRTCPTTAPETTKITCDVGCFFTPATRPAGFDIFCGSTVFGSANTTVTENWFGYGSAFTGTTFNGTTCDTLTESAYLFTFTNSDPSDGAQLSFAVPPDATALILQETGAMSVDVENGIATIAEGAGSEFAAEVGFETDGTLPEFVPGTLSDECSVSNICADTTQVSLIIPVSPVPEPGSLVLVIAGLPAMLAWRLGRRVRPEL